MRMDFATTMPSIGSWFITGIMAVTFISFFKFFFSLFPIPGISEVFQSI